MSVIQNNAIILSVIWNMNQSLWFITQAKYKLPFSHTDIINTLWNRLWLLHWSTFAFIESRRARRNTGKHKHTTEFPHVLAHAHRHKICILSIPLACFWNEKWKIHYNIWRNVQTHTHTHTQIDPLPMLGLIIIIISDCFTRLIAY